MINFTEQEIVLLNSIAGSTRSEYDYVRFFDQMPVKDLNLLTRPGSFLEHEFSKETERNLRNEFGDDVLVVVVDDPDHRTAFTP